MPTVIDPAKELDALLEPLVQQAFWAERTVYVSPAVRGQRVMGVDPVRGLILGDGFLVDFQLYVPALQRRVTWTLTIGLGDLGTPNISTTLEREVKKAAEELQKMRAAAISEALKQGNGHIDLTKLPKLGN